MLEYIAAEIPIGVSIQLAIFIQHWKISHDFPHGIIVEPDK